MPTDFTDGFLRIPLSARFKNEASAQLVQRKKEGMRETSPFNAEKGNTDLAKLKQAFIRHKHPRFLKVFSFNMPYGTGDEYRKHVQQADLAQLTHLVKICGFLIQTKSYLFWKNT
jgi:hypothetical protein